jgi:hypothetical protein
LSRRRRLATMILRFVDLAAMSTLYTRKVYTVYCEK